MTALLEFTAAATARRARAGTFRPRWDQVDDRQVRYIIAAGLGPLLFHATRDTIGQAPAAWRDVLQAADLTARVRHGNLHDATVEVLDACNAEGVPVTLLKGISIAEELYPFAHLRPMADIDILVPKSQCARVEALMLDRGCMPKAGYLADEGEPHRPPLFHPAWNVWIEIHTALFPEGDRLQRNELFSASQIRKQEVASTFDGRPVFRLSRELQLVYVSSYWIRDLSLNPFHPSFVPPMIDAVYLLEASRQAMDWDGLLGWLDNELAAASVFLMLSCIAAHASDDSLTPVLARLASHQRIVGTPELRVITSMIEVVLLGGRPLLGQFGVRHPMIARSIFCSMLDPGSHVGKLLMLPWNIVFPPCVPERYAPRYQLARVRRFVRR